MLIKATLTLTLIDHRVKVFGIYLEGPMAATLFDLIGLRHTEQTEFYTELTEKWYRLPKLVRKYFIKF